MATFTIKLSDLIQDGFDFGLQDYPIFDDKHRPVLNKKILDHYWNYEIGQETESMFKFSLNRKMNEIMPYFNQLYLSTQIEFDPLQTINYEDLVHSSDTRNGTAQNTGDTTSNTTGKSRSVSSTTPQVQLAGNEDYASSATDVNTDTDVSGNTVSNSSHNDSGTGTIDRTVKGSQGIASELLLRYRATFLNIDMDVIRSLETLFMQIWDNGDEFSNNHFLSGSFRYGFGIL